MYDAILTYGPFMGRLVERIKERHPVIRYTGGLPTDLALEQRNAVRALVTLGSRTIGADFMAAFPNLGLITCFGSGYEGIDLAAAAERGISVGNSRGANAASVADFALALLLASARYLMRADEFVRIGKWSSQSWLGHPPARGMSGRRIGIYGMGAIGEKIASRAAAFEAEVTYYSRTRKDHLPYRYVSSLTALADWCDTLVVAVRASAENRHVIDAALLSRIGKQGLLINISRGSVVDEAALVDALRLGTIAGAGLDVFENEPHVRAELLSMSNVVLSPHQAGHTLEAYDAMAQSVMDNLTAFFARRALPYPVEVRAV